MPETPKTKEATPATGSRLRRGALWLLFALVLLIPKTLGLRRRERLWNALRATMGAAGAALAAAGWLGHGGWPVIAAGVALLLAALAVGPERLRPSVDARARELGALVVVEGGRTRGADGETRETLLFVGPERLWVTDAALRALLEVPVTRITQLRAEPAGEEWKLALQWDGGAAEFFFRGPFAEHFARVAESTVRSQIPNALPILR